MQKAPTESTDAKDTPLFEAVFQRISNSEDLSIPFSDYMREILYHEEGGYYSRLDENRIGREGDFYTSVTVGETFGFLLAQQIVNEWSARFDKPDSFLVVEQGAHDGTLALDVVRGIQEISPVLFDTFLYRIIEPRKKHREWLEKRLSTEAGAEKIQIVPDVAGAKAPEGIFLCNELLDAFPFDCFEMQKGEWREKRIAIDQDRFAWKVGEANSDFENFVTRWQSEYPEGYTTEFCTELEPWMDEISTLFQKGLWWIIDYGYEGGDYYAPSRTTGTMRCYRRHQATEDPFESPGEIDITAHVDFTRLGEVAEERSLSVENFTDQHHFLIEASKPWLMGLEGQAPDARAAKRLRQFQTLTHPSIMGQQFKVMVLSKGG